MFREIKWAYQRATRGWSEKDSWNINGHIAEILPPMLRSIAKNHAGCPVEFWDKEKLNDECHRWAETLEEIAQGFEAYTALQHMSYFEFVKEEDGYKHEINKEKLKLLTAKYDRGMLLFSQYYMNLWD
jgi:hypothetical protein